MLISDKKVMCSPVCLSVRLFIFPWLGLHEKFTKSCKIMDYCCGNDPLNSGVDSTQNHSVATILDFCYGNAT